jgi:hypothetical protein
MLLLGDPHNCKLLLHACMLLPDVDARLRLLPSQEGWRLAARAAQH